jgi:hypothetical protein
MLAAGKHEVQNNSIMVPGFSIILITAAAGKIPEGMLLLLSGLSAESKITNCLCVLCVSNERSEWAVNLCLNSNGPNLVTRFDTIGVMDALFGNSEKILRHLDGHNFAAGPDFISS